MPASIFTDSPLGTAGACVFLAGLAAAVMSDVRSRRIPNVVVLALAVAGFVFSTLVAGPVHGGLTSAAGLGVGLLLWFPLFAFGVMGAGDVKLFAASAAWLGPERALIGSVVGALAGGVLAIGWLLRVNGVGFTAAQITTGGFSARRVTLDPRSRRAIPYGVALAFGAACAAWFPRLFSGG